MSTEPTVPDDLWRDPEFQAVSMREQRLALLAYDKGARDALRSLAASFEKNGMAEAAADTRRALAVVEKAHASH